MFPQIAIEDLFLLMRKKKVLKASDITWMYKFNYKYAEWSPREAANICRRYMSWKPEIYTLSGKSSEDLGQENYIRGYLVMQAKLICGLQNLKGRVECKCNIATLLEKISKWELQYDHLFLYVFEIYTYTHIYFPLCSCFHYVQDVLNLVGQLASYITVRGPWSWQCRI